MLKASVQSNQVKTTCTDHLLNINLVKECIMGVVRNTYVFTYLRITYLHRALRLFYVKKFEINNLLKKSLRFSGFYLLVFITVEYESDTYITYARHH